MKQFDEAQKVLLALLARNLFSCDYTRHRLVSGNKGEQSAVGALACLQGLQGAAA